MLMILLVDNNFLTNTFYAMKNKITTLLFAILITGYAAGNTPEIWMEQRENMPVYDLHGKKILMVVGYDYDHHEVFDIRETWESWGATVHVSAAESITEGHTIAFNGVWFDSEINSVVETDVLLNDASMIDYDALYFPGGSGPEHLVKEHPGELYRLIDEALEKQATIGAICGGPFALTAHDHFKGVKMTVSPSKRQEMENYGIKYVNEPVVLGNRLITGNWPFFETFAITMAHNILHPDNQLADIFPESDCYLCDFLQSQRAPMGFTNKKITEEDLSQMLSSGIALPWVRFMHQNWHFIAVNCPAKRAKLKENVFQNIEENNLHPNASKDQLKNYWNNMLDNPVLLLGFFRSDPDALNTAMTRFMETNLIAAGTQISIAANYKGLATQWITAMPTITKPVTDVLKTGEDLHLVFAMALGYPKAYALPNTRKSLDQVLDVI